jgi:uncharacterized membrane protein YgcG
VGGLVLGLLLVLLAIVSWLRHGRDPVYLDDASVLLPAPPPELSPALATLLLDDRTNDRTVTTGLVDLAARGWLAFHTEPDPDGSVQTGLECLTAEHGDLPAPEDKLRKRISEKAASHQDYIEPNRLYHLAEAFSEFKSDLETAAVKRAWLTARPGDVITTWQLIGSLEIVAAIVALLIWLISAASGVLVVAGGLAVGGAVSVGLSWSMPSRTRQGAMLYAMLSAYRRSMARSLEQARSFGDVVKDRALPWVATPDAAMVWGIALGLNGEVQAVLARSILPPDEAAAATASGTAPAWRPGWWLAGTGPGGLAHGPASSASQAAGTAGLFSATLLPDPGSILASLGTIARVSPPGRSSGGSGSSSFGGGGSFGGGSSIGGGGAGGGF